MRLVARDSIKKSTWFVSLLLLRFFPAILLEGKVKTLAGFAVTLHL